LWQGTNPQANIFYPSTLKPVGQQCIDTSVVSDDGNDAAGGDDAACGFGENPNGSELSSCADRHS